MEHKEEGSRNLNVESVYRILTECYVEKMQLTFFRVVFFFIYEIGNGVRRSSTLHWAFTGERYVASRVCKDHQHPLSPTVAQVRGLAASCVVLSGIQGVSVPSLMVVHHIGSLGALSPIASMLEFFSVRLAMSGWFPNPTKMA